MAPETRQQMITTAARLFQRDGYNATSWRGLVEAAGAPWGSIHHHFPGGKAELGVAAIEAGRDAVTAIIDRCFAEQADASKAVERWVEVSARLLVDSGYESGCPVATVALETLAGPEPVRHASRRALDTWQKQLATHLRNGGISRTRAADAATSVLALLEGSLLLSRVQGSDRPMRIAARQARAIVIAAVGSSSAE
jgi:TetR/AcrR family transcriptional regulator, lmrAB and yxaGH operons repressor